MSGPTDHSRDRIFSNSDADDARPRSRTRRGFQTGRHGVGETRPRNGGIPRPRGEPDRPPARMPRGAARPRRGRTCGAGAPASSSSSTAPPTAPRGPGSTPADGRATRRSRGPSAAGPAALDRSVGSRRRTGCAERSRTIARHRACFHHRRRVQRPRASGWAGRGRWSGSGSGRGGRTDTSRAWSGTPGSRWLRGCPARRS